LNRQLHIVSLDAPWPPDYGGAIDIFYKMKALHEAGVRIHLHYFSYNDRGGGNELGQYCESVHVYPRRTGHRGFSLKTPYIISSRTDSDLTKKLNEDDHPVLLEGLHCTGFLDQLKLEDRRVIVRLHNEEARYYRQQAPLTGNLFKKIYYRHESRLLDRYESSLPAECHYACITESDTSRFREHHGLEKSFYLPVFTPHQEVKCEQGMGTFCLYHGNLSVPENEKAAAWLLTKVFSRLKVPLVIAGKAPSRKLRKLGHLCQHTCLVADPSEKEMNELVAKAHINILPAFTTTGIKIKLLHALFEGRHCITNDDMVSGTGLEAACHTANKASALAAIVMQLYHQPFSEDEIRLRRRVLSDRFSNAKNANALIRYLW
jgi:hypothetical protein